MKVRLLHLVVTIGLSTVVAGVGGVAATYWVIEDEVQDLLDDDLEAQSELFAQVLAAKGALVSPEELEALIQPIFEWDQEETLWVNVYDPATGRHVSNLDHSLPVPAPGARKLDLALQGHRWIGYQHHHPAGPVVQLLHRRDRYQEVREEVLEGAAIPALAVTGVNLLLLAGLTLLFLGPLTRLASELEQRKAESLAPVAVKTPAHEVRVLRDVMNRLMADVEIVLRREREFASDVAHELRTPLATLKLELSSDSPDGEALKSEVDRLVALVNQLLTLARLQRTHWRESFERVALDGLYAGHLRELSSRLREKGLSLHADLRQAEVSGDRMLLEVLLGNLIDNAVHHCPPGTEVDVELVETGSEVVLRVRDTGPGMPLHHLESLNAGFTRLDQRSQGLGLGLTICHKIAEVHGASLTFAARADGTSGLEVHVRFPRLRPS